MRNRKNSLISILFLVVFDPFMPHEDLDPENWTSLFEEIEAEKSLPTLNEDIQKQEEERCYPYLEGKRNYPCGK